MTSLAVSVIIPTHNRAHLVTRAVESALAAIGPNDEIIVVDDGSTDNTAEVLTPYTSRIRYLSGPHRSAAATRNRGMQAARNPLIAFLDSDDEWMSDKLLLQRRLMEQRPDVLFSFSDFAAKYHGGGERRWYLERWHEDPVAWAASIGEGTPYSTIASLPPGRDDFQVHIRDYYQTIMELACVCTTTFMVRRSAVGTAMWCAEDLARASEWESFGRVARAGLGAFLNIETAWLWSHPGPRLTDASRYEYAATRLTILERVWGQDQEFLAQHRDRYLKLRSAQHVQMARWLCSHGRTREARAALRMAGGGTLADHALAALPSGLARGLSQAIPRRLIYRIRQAPSAIMSLRRMRGISDTT